MKKKKKTLKEKLRELREDIVIITGAIYVMFSIWFDDKFGNK